MPLSQALAQHAATRPARTALRMGAHVVDYATLWRGIRARYAALSALPRAARQVSPHQPLIALSLGNHTCAPEWLALALAAPVTLALLDPQWPEALRSEMLARGPCPTLDHAGDAAVHRFHLRHDRAPQSLPA
jgi:hypothetical protein